MSDTRCLYWGFVLLPQPLKDMSGSQYKQWMILLLSGHYTSVATSLVNFSPAVSFGVFVLSGCARQYVAVAPTRCNLFFS